MHHLVCELNLNKTVKKKMVRAFVPLPARKGLRQAQMMECIASQHRAVPHGRAMLLGQHLFPLTMAPGPRARWVVIEPLGGNVSGLEP